MGKEKEELGNGKLLTPQNLTTFIFNLFIGLSRSFPDVQFMQEILVNDR
jgi:hypothetical protein